MSALERFECMKERIKPEIIDRLALVFLRLDEVGHPQLPSKA
jgi:hypothetical protein